MFNCGLISKIMMGKQNVMTIQVFLMIMLFIS